MNIAAPPLPDPPCDHWLPIPGCKPPMNATWIIGLVPRHAPPVYTDILDRLEAWRNPPPPITPADCAPRRVHWACGGGEEQPPYRGWFVEACPGTHFGVPDPIAWRPEAGTCTRCGGALPLHTDTL